VLSSKSFSPSHNDTKVVKTLFIQVRALLPSCCAPRLIRGPISGGRTSRRRAVPFAAGMPSSDDDPCVLEARRMLWTAIDAALANYSLEIIAMGV